MKKSTIMWILTGFFGLTALVFMPSFASLVAVAAAVILAPIDKWQKILGKYVGGVLKTIIVIVMTIVIAFSAPETETEDAQEDRGSKSFASFTVPTSESTTSNEETEPLETETTIAETTKDETEPASAVTTPPATEPAPVVTTPPATEPAPVVTTPPATEPAPVVTTPPATEAPSEQMVWIPTNGGKRYHSHSGCSQMENPSYVTITYATSVGFTPCGRCY